MSNLSDTDEAVQRLIYEKLRAMTPAERLRRMNDLCVVGRSLMLNAVKASKPSISQTALRREYARRLLGKDFKLLYPDSEDGMGS